MILILPTLAWGKEEDEIAEICEARFQKVESMAKETFGAAKGIALERDTSDGDCVINFDYPEKGFLYTFQFPYKENYDQSLHIHFQQEIYTFL